MVNAVSHVVFDPEGSSIEDVDTRDRMELKEKEGMYMLKMWVQKPFRGKLRPNRKPTEAAEAS